MNEYIVISCSSRALAECANRAGYSIHVIDSFSDADTVSISKSVHQVQFIDDGFDEEDLLSKLKQILVTSPRAKLVLGSGFEAKSEIINQLNKLAPTFSNSPQTITTLKDPISFSNILQQHKIPHPKTQRIRPDSSTGFLRKKIAGQGGEHIHWLDKCKEDLNKNYYFQQYIAGDVYSVLFLANGKEAKVVGFNQQLQSDDFADLPFLYKGAISLNNNINKISEIIEKHINILTIESDLKGLCGLDYIVSNTGEVVVLEVNPRPPATLDLYSDYESLFEAHIACFAGELVDLDRQYDENMHFRGAAILYAKENLTISNKILWPDWVKDKPQAKTTIKANFPVCTVHARENSLDKVKALLFNRLSQIETIIDVGQNTA